MKFTLQNNSDQTIGLKRFLNQQGISHRMYHELRATNDYVFINDIKIPFGSEVPAQATVTIDLPAEEADASVAVSKQPLTVLMEDENWLVVDKPVGLTSVPGPSNRADTLVNRVKGHWQDINSDNLVPHIITRLDRDTSGGVLVARHRLANSLANMMQENHDISKSYVAIVSGTGLDDHGMIDAPLAKNPAGYNQIITETGKPAQTEYWKMEELTDATIVKVKLHTGRTHQIRAHFQSINHPLLGDELYGGKKVMVIKHQALHAYQLEFVDPFSGQQINMISPLPEDLKQYLATQKIQPKPLMAKLTK